MAPDAVADKSSSENSEAADSAGSIIAELLAVSSSTVEGGASSRALAAGRIVATSSNAEVNPQIVTDFFELFSSAVFTICSPSVHLSPLGVHPRILSIGNQPQLRLQYLRGMPLW
jgi:hypothetical protein